MAYRDIIKGRANKSTYKESLVPVFSEIVGENEGQGKLAEFIQAGEESLQLTTGSGTKEDFNFKKDLEKALNKFIGQTELSKQWITLMGLLERKILQLRCFRNPSIAYHLLEQKSGENKFSYIVIRAPFIDLYSGRKEIRMYFNKIEDYPKYGTLDELKEDRQFREAATLAIKKQMSDHMLSEGITIEYLEQELTKVQSPAQQRLALQFESEAKKKAGANQSFERMQQRLEIESEYSPEQKEEIALHRANLAQLRNSPAEKDKEKQRHNDKWKQLSRLKHDQSKPSNKGN